MSNHIVDATKMVSADIIAMAREAAAKHGHTFKDVPEQATLEFIKAFAELARADERKRLLDGVEMPEPEINTASHGHFRVVGYTADQLRETVAAAVARKDAEIERVTLCLALANSNHEEFERKWYLACDERDALKAEVERLKAAAEIGRAMP